MAQHIFLSANLKDAKMVAASTFSFQLVRENDSHNHYQFAAIKIN